MHTCDFNGTTSAYAEKRQGPPGPQGPQGNYLRIRGEELIRSDQPCDSPELPPHTRRRDRVRQGHRVHRGTTSAYAEKS